jgi:hypothetical protein
VEKAWGQQRQERGQDPVQDQDHHRPNLQSGNPHDHREDQVVVVRRWEPVDMSMAEAQEAKEAEVLVEQLVEQWAEPMELEVER